MLGERFLRGRFGLTLLTLFTKVAAADVTLITGLLLLRRGDGEGTLKLLLSVTGRLGLHNLPSTSSGEATGAI